MDERWMCQNCGVTKSRWSDTYSVGRWVYCCQACAEDRGCACRWSLSGFDLQGKREADTDLFEAGQSDEPGPVNRLKREYWSE